MSARATLAIGATLALAASTNARAASDPGGYIGKGNIVVQTAVAGIDKLTVGGDIALEARGTQVRLDVLSLAIPGSNAVVSSLVGTQLFPPGGFTIVFDRTTFAYTVWSNARRAYYTSAAASTGPASAPTSSPSAASGTASDLLAPLAVAKSFRDDAAFSMSLALVGHGPVNGHPATGFDYQYARTTKDGAKTDLHGRLQLADDLDEAPVEVTASIKTKSIPESSMRLDLTSLAKQTPNDADFAVPAGYARAADLGTVLGKTLSP